MRRTFRRSEIILDAPNGTPMRRGSRGSSIQYSYETGLERKLDSVHSKRVLILMQDRCTVCAEHTIASEIILDAPDGTPR
jgi:hypothetical protein